MFIVSKVQNLKYCFEEKIESSTVVSVYWPDWPSSNSVSWGPNLTRKIGNVMISFPVYIQSDPLGFSINLSHLEKVLKKSLPVTWAYDK